MYGSIATKLDPNNRPPNISPDHTHRWTVYLKGVDGADVTHWIKKVQFKLHETYSQSLRTIEAPGPFEVTETGWGEFEVAIKIFFVSEANEKPTSVYHPLKLHPYGVDAEKQKENDEPIESSNYEEVVFNEPSEAFLEILTSPGPVGAKGKTAGKTNKHMMIRKNQEHSAEIPQQESRTNPYSLRTEGLELDRLKEARKVVDGLIAEGKKKLAEQEETLRNLRQTEGTILQPKA